MCAYADEAVLIGPAPSNQSYLVIEKIIDAQRRLALTPFTPAMAFFQKTPFLHVR